MGSSLKTVCQAMNGGCCSTNKQSDYSTKSFITDRARRQSDSSSDEEYSYSKERTDNLCSSGSIIYSEHSNQPSYSTNQQQKILIGFKDAIKKGNDSLVSYFIKEHSSLNLIDTKWQNGNTCLHVAVENKSFGLIKYLLSKGASPNQQNEMNGDTALHAAARIRNDKCVILLNKYDA
eukprot:183583_1